MTIAGAGFIALVLIAKLVLIWRININWDEFYYLNLVHDYLRGETSRVFQQFHVHLFSWLPAVAGNEIGEVVAGRAVMWICLALTAWLILLLARRWVAPTAAIFAPLTYLLASPILRHGAAFRSDSLLAPLILIAILVLSNRRPGRRHLLLAGMTLGAAFAISIKTILVAPVVLLLLWPGSRPNQYSRKSTLHEAAMRAVMVAASAALVAATLLVWHWSTLSLVEDGAIQGFAANAAKVTLLDVPLLPRWDYLQRTFHADWVCWALLAGGAVVAIARRSIAIVYGLSLLPLLVYRNAFPYFYVVMLAPASVLAAIAVDALVEFARRSARRHSAAWVLPAVSLPLIAQGALNLQPLCFDRQGNQRLTVEAVHQIFSSPVPYIDHSGMIASFRKVNFFMSSWGLMRYEEQGTGFMSEAIAKYRPPLLLANAGLLSPDSTQFRRLLPEDQFLIRNSYVHFWGPIYVAGVATTIKVGGDARVRVPFAGRYRVECEGPIRIDGMSFANGDVLSLTEAQANEVLVLTQAGSGDEDVRLVWAQAARPDLPPLPPLAPLYSEL